MAASTTSNGITTSFTKTPQAGDDIYNLNEDNIFTYTTSDGHENVVSLDVMSNDLGGGAKSLFALDDGNGNPLAPDFDLLVKDVGANGISAWELTANGNLIRINNGKIELDLSHSLSVLGASNVNSLTANDHIDDVFVYSIRLANGTLSQARVLIHVDGANDAATFAGSDSGNVTEDATLHAGGTLTVSDVDHGQSSFQAADTGSHTGTYGTFSFNAATGQWGYDLANGQANVQALAAGEQVTDTLTVHSADGTTHDIKVTITGTNDAPKVTGAVVGAATEGSVSSTLDALANASDVDHGAHLSVVSVGSLPAGVSYDAANHSFTLDPTDGAYDHLAANQTTTVTVTYGVSDGTATTPASVSWTVTGTNDAPVVTGTVTGSATEGGASSTLNALANASDVDDNTTLSVVNVGSLPAGVSYDAANHSFTLDPTDGAYDHLAADEPTTVTVTYDVSDGTTTTPASVSWTVTGTNDAPKVTGAVTGSVTEGGASSTLNALANASDVDDNTTLSVVNVGSLPAGVSYDAANHSFTLDPTDGAYDHLAAGQPTTVTVAYDVSDGTTTTPGSVSWTVTGTNDAPVVTGAVTGSATEGGSSSTLNALANASDVDDNTMLSVVNVGSLPAGVSYDAANHSFTLDPTDGAYDHLAADEPTTVTVTYDVSDGTTTTPASVSWTVTGTNDAPKVTGAVTGSVTEGGASSTLNALANASDVDDNTTLSVVNVGSLPAGVSYDAANHSFTLDPTDGAYDHLAAGQPTTVTVAYDVSDGITTTPGSVSWTVTGTNDGASITGTATGNVTEDSLTTTTGGTLSVSDVDTGQNTFAAGDNGPHAGAYGSFNFDTATGQWGYTLDNSNSAVEALNDGGTLHDYLTVHSSDGTASQQIDVTINGHSDVPPDIDGPDGLVFVPTQTGNSTLLGHFAEFGDTDPNDTFTYAMSNLTTNNGSSLNNISLDPSNGNLSVVASNSVQESYNFTITVTDQGGHTASGNYHVLVGFSGNNNDQLNGGSGTDIIAGENGKDTLQGGVGVDYLIGGSQADTYKYTNITESQHGAADVIWAFEASGQVRDSIDLSGVDSQAQTVTVGSSFTTLAAHSIEVVQNGTNATVYVNTSNSAISDANSASMEIQLTGVSGTIVAGDILHT